MDLCWTKDDGWIKLKKNAQRCNTETIPNIWESSSAFHFPLDNTFNFVESNMKYYIWLDFPFQLHGVAFISLCNE